MFVFFFLRKASVGHPAVLRIVSVLLKTPICGQGQWEEDAIGKTPPIVVSHFSINLVGHSAKVAQDLGNRGSK